MGPETAIPDLPTLMAYVRWWASRTPDAEAVVAGGDRATYAQLLTEVARAAAALRACGVKAGDRVAMILPPRPEFLVTLLAANSIGAIWVGLNPRYRLEELRHLLHDCEPCLLFTRARTGERDLAGEFMAAGDAFPHLRQVITLDSAEDWPGSMTYQAFLGRGAEGGDEAAPDMSDPSAPSMIVYTSGSTGKPKGAVLSQGGLAQFARNQNRLWPISPLRVLNYFPINHVGCVCDISAPAVAAGGCIVFLEQFDPRGSLEIMVRERVSLWASVPSAFQLQLALPDIGEFDLSAVQLIVWEGAAMAPETLSVLHAYGRPMATNYGMTEMTSAITALEPTRDLDLLTSTVGSPFPEVEVRIADADGIIVRLGAEGEIQARSRQQLLGYWKAPEATRESLTSDGYFKTGDLGVQRPDGRLRIVGRLKEMYKSGGYNVYPREVEAVLEAHPLVNAAAVVSVSDPLWGESGVAFVETHEPVEGSVLIDWCRERLANYKIPKRLEFQGALPLLPIGKIDKAALARLAAAQQHGATDE